MTEIIIAAVAGLLLGLLIGIMAMRSGRVRLVTVIKASAES